LNLWLSFAVQYQSQKIMSQTTSPPYPVPPQPPTSQLAIWSLVLGLLSFVCFSIFTAIPAVICGHKALNRINSSGGGLTGKGLAIGGLITGYLAIAWAIFFIPLMLAIAIPNFVKARHVSMENACINNLRQIEAAKNQWALEKGKTGGDVLTANDLTPYLAGGKFPVCPDGGIYTIGAVTNDPTCSVPGHELSQ
jgi:hypothetical protein